MRVFTLLIFIPKQETTEYQTQHQHGQRHQDEHGHRQLAVVGVFLSIVFYLEPEKRRKQQNSRRQNYDYHLALLNPQGLKRSPL